MLGSSWRVYSGSGRRTSAAVVARIAAPILVTVAPKTKRRRGRCAVPAASEPATGNVVPVVFGGCGLNDSEISGNRLDCYAVRLG